MIATALAPLDPAALMWQVTSDRAKGCTHPVRLVGSASQVDKTTGEIRQVYSSDREFDGTLYRPCGNRRESVCPACAETYRRDAYHLITAGLAGGKGIPESVAGHPALFLTLSAPSFGPVHSRRTKGRVAEFCRPRAKFEVCRHGVRSACWSRHEEDDPRQGEPICPECFDYAGLVVWNAHAPKLWKRTRETLGRTLAHLAGLTNNACQKQVRLTFVKVAEVQHRGAAHFHGVLRADLATKDGMVLPPPSWCTPELMRDAFDQAAATTEVPVVDPHSLEANALDALAASGLVDAAEAHAVAHAPLVTARWGDQNLAKLLRVDGEDMSTGKVAGYIAKYATKSTDAVGNLDRPIRTAEALELLELSGRVRPHLFRIVKTSWLLGYRREYKDLKLRKWAHCLGFGGHWLTKSRRYSTTFGALRTARRKHTIRTKLGDLEPLDQWGRPETEEAVIVFKEWRVDGYGYRTQPERDLALASAARTREYRAALRTQRAASKTRKRP